jgi:hypothetical protein
MLRAVYVIDWLSRLFRSANKGKKFSEARHRQQPQSRLDFVIEPEGCHLDFAVSAKATLHPIWTTVVPNCFFGLKTCKGRFFTADDAMLLQLLREPRIVFQVHVFKAKRSNCRRLGCEDERRNTSTLRRISFVSRVIVTPGTLASSVRLIPASAAVTFSRRNALTN